MKHISFNAKINKITNSAVKHSSLADTFNPNFLNNSKEWFKRLLKNKGNEMINNLYNSRLSKELGSCFDAFSCVLAIVFAKNADAEVNTCWIESTAVVCIENIKSDLFRSLVNDVIGIAGLCAEQKGYEMDLIKVVLKDSAE